MSMDVIGTTPCARRSFQAGTFGDHKGINLPGVAVSLPSLTEKDLDRIFASAWRSRRRYGGAVVRAHRRRCRANCARWSAAEPAAARGQDRKATGLGEHRQPSWRRATA